MDRVQGRDLADAHRRNPYLILASTFLFRRAESTEIQNPSRRLSIVTEVSPPTVNKGRLWIGRETTHTQFLFHSIVADDSGRRRDLAPSNFQQSVGGTEPLYRALTARERS